MPAPTTTTSASTSSASLANCGNVADVAQYGVVLLVVRGHCHLIFRGVAPRRYCSSSSGCAASAAPWLIPPSARLESFLSAAFSSLSVCCSSLAAWVWPMACAQATSVP